MVALPARPAQEIIRRVYSAIEDKNKEKNPDLYLGRLGSSFIGGECIRKIWLEWRGFSRGYFDGRMLRLFETGHIQETRIIENLKAAGFQVWSHTEDGKQFEFIDGTGHFITKTDGIIKGVPGSESLPHILEIKTHNKNSFTALVKKGVFESKPEHYVQMQTSMRYSGMTQALYVAVCKDDEKLYVEIVKEDLPEHSKVNNKIISLVNATMRPAGISDDASSYGCKFCDVKEVCVKEEKPLRHCRTCDLSAAAENGTWVCSLTGNTLDVVQQRAGCENYEEL